ncbi:hypothetical protein HYC85_010844 [Camellia sinensis]|uniref:B box-type domain-containing protein n=1 Tax=Camellia sinensis TaxID=4442 RepID=A0A7J7HJ22_CAMSI|nr:hypothetical protein HYC85_010844 [Camellia sinensis]
MNTYNGPNSASKRITTAIYLNLLEATPMNRSAVRLDSSHLPRWLEALLGEKFFNACIIHEEAKKNEKNIFCLDCCHSICPHCLSPHRSHRLLQIRRYVYHDVIRLGDAEKLMDCAFVQSYTTNSAKVVFLNQRPQTRSCRGSGNICFTCERGLQDPYLFCSLSCKVYSPVSLLPIFHFHLFSSGFLFFFSQIQHILRTEGKLSSYIFECLYLTLPESGFDDGQMTPDTVLEQAGSLRTSSGSSGSGGVAGEVGCRTMGCTATTEIARKKRSSVSASRPEFRPEFRPVCAPGSEISVGMMNRRKATPHRSPLY